MQESGLLILYEATDENMQKSILHHQMDQRWYAPVMLSRQSPERILPFLLGPLLLVEKTLYKTVNQLLRRFFDSSTESSMRIKHPRQNLGLQNEEIQYTQHS